MLWHMVTHIPLTGTATLSWSMRGFNWFNDVQTKATSPATNCLVRSFHATKSVPKFQWRGWCGTGHVTIRLKWIDVDFNTFVNFVFVSQNAMISVICITYLPRMFLSSDIFKNYCVELAEKLPWIVLTFPSLIICMGVHGCYMGVIVENCLYFEYIHWQFIF